MLTQEQLKNLVPGDVLFYDGNDNDAFALSGDVRFIRTRGIPPEKDVVVICTTTFDDVTTFNAEQIISITNLHVKGT